MDHFRPGRRIVGMLEQNSGKDQVLVMLALALLGVREVVISCLPIAIVESLSRVRLFMTRWTVTCTGRHISFTNSVTSYRITQTSFWPTKHICKISCGISNPCSIQVSCVHGKCPSFYVLQFTDMQNSNNKIIQIK